jgi:PTH1 family peptidyl-tRNA hydrolase
MQTIKPKLIIGLGNPDEKYAKTFHNAGRLFADFMAEGKFENAKNFAFSKEKGFVAVKPLTFMNESGKAVSEAVKYFSGKKKIKPEEILIAHDDSDIMAGEYKLSFGKNSAGHRGVESAIKALKTKDFWRLRIGIRPAFAKAMAGKQKKRAKAADFVLKKMSPLDAKKMSENFKKIKELIEKSELKT